MAGSIASTARANGIGQSIAVTGRTSDMRAANHAGVVRGAPDPARERAVDVTDVGQHGRLSPEKGRRVPADS
jgi:hypothetical protein